MELSDRERNRLFAEMDDIEYVPGKLNSNFKYKALISRDLWNKWRPDKPLVQNEFKVVNFGRPGYQQYKDLIGLWRKYDHNDEGRRQRYRARHEPIMIDINGKKYHSYLVPFTNEFFSYWLMW